MNTNTATEYRNLPLAVLTESATNPRRIFEDSALKSQGVLSPLLVRPLTDQSFEIVAGARRYRAAQMAEVATVPVRIVNLTDAEALEAQLIELSIVGKSLLCFYAPSARRSYVIDVSSSPKLLDATECLYSVRWNAVADNLFGALLIRHLFQSKSAMGNAVH